MTKNAKGKITGTFTFDDPAANFNISTTTFSSLSFMGHSASLTGTAKVKKNEITFTVNVTDNGKPGTLDFFSIQATNGVYSASGNLLSGNITIK